MMMVYGEVLGIDCHMSRIKNMKKKKKAKNNDDDNDANVADYDGNPLRKQQGELLPEHGHRGVHREGKL